MRDDALWLVDAGVHKERVIELERHDFILVIHHAANDICQQRFRV